MADPIYRTAMMGPMARVLVAAHTSDAKGFARHLTEQALSIFDSSRELTPEESLRRMRRASDEFYGMAVSTGVHAFIEFAGLMNEFIKVCEEAERQGMEWTQANTHSKANLPFQSYHVEYLNEKLECIFQGLSFGEVKKKEVTDA